MPYLKHKVNEESVNTRSQSGEQFEVELEEVLSGSQHVEMDGTDDQSQGSEAQEPELVQPQQTQPDLAKYQLARDRQRRTNTRVPARFIDSEMLFFALHIAEQLQLDEPASYAETIKGPESKQWIQAMKEEIDSLI